MIQVFYHVRLVRQPLPNPLPPPPLNIIKINQSIHTPCNSSSLPHPFVYCPSKEIFFLTCCSVTYYKCKKLSKVILCKISEYDCHVSWSKWKRKICVHSRWNALLQALRISLWFPCLLFFPCNYHYTIIILKLHLKATRTYPLDHTQTFECKED